MNDFGGQQFASTRWSVVLKAKTPEEESGRAALEELCKAYWQPLYSFVRRKGYDAQTAADLTQGFFLHLLEKQILEKSAPDRGRFRSFLLACIQNFINNQHDRENAIKRGGKMDRIPLDVAQAESKFTLVSNVSTPELVFEKEWANSLLQKVHQRLDDSTNSQRIDLHHALKSYLTTEPGDNGYQETAQQFGMTVVAVRVAVFRLRDRFRKLLRQEVAETLQKGDEIEEEIAHLLSVLSE